MGRVVKFGTLGEDQGKIILAIKGGSEVDLALRPSPVRTACSTQNSFITGNIPGIAASTTPHWHLVHCQTRGRTGKELRV